MDFQRLAKLLALTTSENDHEALSAIRQANKLLKAEKLTWEQVIQSPAPAASIFGPKTAASYEAWRSRPAPQRPVTVEEELERLRKMAEQAAGAQMDDTAFLSEIEREIQARQKAEAPRYTTAREAEAGTRPEPMYEKMRRMGIF